MSSRASAITIVIMLGLFLVFILFYEGTTDPTEMADPLVDMYENNPAVTVIEPQRITALVEQNIEEARGDEHFFKTLPASLSDTPLPTALGVDEDEELIADHRVRNLFEYYLTAIGEEPLESIVARIKYDLSQQLSGAALAQANDILEGYLQYRNNMAVIKNQFVNQYGNQTYSLDIIKEMKVALRASRFNFLSEEVVEAFFQQEDEYDDYMMAKVQLMSDRFLSQLEKDDLQNQLDQNAPRWITDADQKANHISNVRAQESTLKEQGAGDAEIYALREQAYGAEGAENLKALDIQRKQWKQLVALYHVDLNSMIASSGGSDYIDQELLQSLRAQYFEGPELTRIQAIDKIEIGL